MQMSPSEHAAAVAVYESSAVSEIIQALYSRWLVEREVEDFAEYADRMKAVIEAAGAIFVKAKKRPFGCEFAIGGRGYSLSVNSRDYWMLAL